MKKTNVLLIILFLMLSVLVAFDAINKYEDKKASEYEQSISIKEEKLFSMPESLSFSDLPSDYEFLSGVGGWSTVLTLNNDGSFEGIFADHDVGASLVYFSTFKGAFSAPVKSGNCFTVTIESIELTEEVEKVFCGKDMKYVVSDPYGLENAKSINIYLPGTPFSSIPSNSVKRWLHLSESLTEVPESMFLLYNKEEDYIFSSYDRSEREADISKNTPNDDYVLGEAVSERGLLPLSDNDIIELFKNANNFSLGTLLGYEVETDENDTAMIFRGIGTEMQRVTACKYKTAKKIHEERFRFFSNYSIFFFGMEETTSNLALQFADEDGKLYASVLSFMEPSADPAMTAKLVITKAENNCCDFYIVAKSKVGEIEDGYCYTVCKYTLELIDGRWVFSAFEPIPGLFSGSIYDFGSNTEWFY